MTKTNKVKANESSGKNSKNLSMHVSANVITHDVGTNTMSNSSSLDRSPNEDNKNSELFVKTSAKLSLKLHQLKIVSISDHNALVIECLKGLA